MSCGFQSTTPDRSSITAAEDMYFHAKLLRTVSSCRVKDTVSGKINHGLVAQFMAKPLEGRVSGVRPSGSQPATYLRKEPLLTCTQWLYTY